MKSSFLKLALIALSFSLESSAYFNTKFNSYTVVEFFISVDTSQLGLGSVRIVGSDLPVGVYSSGSSTSPAASSVTNHHVDYGRVGIVSPFSPYRDAMPYEKNMNYLIEAEVGSGTITFQTGTAASPGNTFKCNVANGRGEKDVTFTAAIVHVVTIPVSLQIDTRTCR